MHMGFHIPAVLARKRQGATRRNGWWWKLEVALSEEEIRCPDTGVQLLAGRVVLSLRPWHTSAVDWERQSMKDSWKETDDTQPGTTKNRRLRSDKAWSWRTLPLWMGSPLPGPDEEMRQDGEDSSR